MCAFVSELGRHGQRRRGRPVREPWCLLTLQLQEEARILRKNLSVPGACLENPSSAAVSD